MNRNIPLIAALCTLLTATSVTAQTNNPKATNSTWRSVAIGAGIGSGVGVSLGALADRKASCKNANGSTVYGACGHGGVKFLGISGATFGALTGFLIHRLRR